MKRNILLLFSLCIMMFSCEEVIIPSITLNQTELTVSNASRSESISFESNMNWAAKSSESWCTISSISGDKSTKSIVATLSANDTYIPRSCYVTITAESLSKTLIINQSASLGLLVTQDEYNITNEATTIEVEINANIDYDIDISDDWIIKPTTTRCLTSSILRFGITKNESVNNRDGTIIIKQREGTLESTIKVHQS